MSEMVKLSIDLKSGLLQVEAPVQALESVFNRLESFIPTMSNACESTTSQNPSESVIPGAVGDHENNEATTPAVPEKPARAKRGTGNKKPENLKVVDIQLDQSKRQGLKDFYQSKKPGSQNDQVLVIMYFLNKERNGALLTKDEIFSGIRTVGEKAPKRLASVLTNLTIAGLIRNEGGKFKLVHTGEDYVAMDLPKATNK